MTETLLVAYLVIGTGWAMWTEPDHAEDLDGYPNEIRFFAFVSSMLSWLPEVLATAWLHAVGADWPDRPA